MSELIPERVPESAVVSTRRMPTWAFALAAAMASVCIAIVAVALSVRYESNYHHDLYSNCVHRNKATVLLVDALTKLRNSDVDVIRRSHLTPPETAFDYADLAGIQQQIVAYDELLGEMRVVPDCRRLK